MNIIKKICIIAGFIVITTLGSFVCMPALVSSTLNVYKDGSISIVQGKSIIESSLVNKMSNLHGCNIINGILYRTLGKRVIGNFEFIKDDSGVVRIIADKCDYSQFDSSILQLSRILKQRDTPLVYVNLFNAAEFINGLHAHIVGETPHEQLMRLQKNGIDILNCQAIERRVFGHNTNFYTDFHYTTKTEFILAKTIVNYLYKKYKIKFSLKDNVFSFENYTVSRYPFLGNTVKNVGAYYAGTDSFEIYYPKFTTRLCLYSPFQCMYRQGVFSKVCLNGYELNDIKNTYLVIDYGQYPNLYYKYENTNIKNGPKILVICDSIFMRGFSYLCMACKSVTVYDPRVDSSSSLLCLLLRHNKYDAVLLLGSSDDFFIRGFNLKSYTNDVNLSPKTVISFDAGCSLLKNNQQKILMYDSSKIVKVTGCAFDMSSKRPLRDLFAKVGGIFIKCEYGLENKESETNSINSKFLLNTGFVLKFPIEYLKNNNTNKVEFIPVANSDNPSMYHYANSKQYEVVTRDLNSLSTLQDCKLHNEGLWVDYCNGVIQRDRRIIHLPIVNKNMITLDGWGADFPAGRPFRALYIKICGHIYPCNYGYERQSVVDYFGNKQLLDTGFNVSFPSKLLKGHANVSIQFVGVSARGNERYMIPYSVDFVSEAKEVQPHSR